METETEVVAGPSGEQMEEGLDGKNEKKRKFKPFEAVRKFFRASRKRSKLKEEETANIVCVKAKSTSALMSQQIEEEEDDGGFKTHKTLSQARSISEDSIFNPDPKDSKKANIETFTKGAKSVENINQNFKSELATKLKKRQSFHSDDDGLPKSPMSSFTTADVIMGGLKGTPGKSASRDSDKSLLSVGSSDNEEEDLFQTNWKASVASVVTRRSKGAPSTDSGMELDLSAVQPTTALKSDAAKHRISVAPKARRGARQGKKTQLQKKTNASALPKLTEESPSKLSKEEDVIQTELTFPATKEVTVKPVSKKAESQEKISVDKSVETPSISPEPSKPSFISGKPLLKQKLSGEKTEEIVSKSTAPCASAPSSTKSTATEDVKIIEKSDEKEKKSSSGVTELSQAFNRLRKTSGKKTEDASQDSDKENISEETVLQKSSDSNSDKQKPAGKQPLAKTSESRGSLKTVGLPEKATENSGSKTSSVKEVSSSKVSENADSQGVVKQALRPTLSAQSDSSVEVGSARPKRDSIKEESGSRTIESKDNKAQDAETLSSVRASLRPGLKTSVNKDTQAEADAKTFDSKVAFSSGLKSTGSSDVSVSVSKDSKVSEGSSTDAKGNVAQEKAESASTVSGAKAIYSGKTNTEGNLGLQRLSSPKEEYKQKRQGRSRTLPEQPLAKEVVKSSVLPSSSDYDNVTINDNKPQLGENTAKVESNKTQAVEEELITKKAGDKAGSSPPSSPARQGLTVITTAAKRPEPKRLSLKSGLVSDSSEPVWVAMARKKKAQEEDEEGKESSDSSKGDESSDSSKTMQKSDTTPGKSATQSSPAKSPLPSSPAKTPLKEAKVNTKVSPPSEMKSASKPILIENKPPSKVEGEEKSSSAPTPTPTDSRSVLVSRPAVKFVRNLPPSKPATSTPAAVSKPAYGQSFSIDKPAPMTSKPSTETWKVTPAKPEGTSGGLKASGGSSIPGPKTFTIDKSSLGSASSSGTAKPAEKKEETKPSSVPAWRSNLQKKKESGEIKVPEMKKIEIIEKSTPRVSPQKASQTKTAEKSTDETPVIMREKAKADKCSDVASARSSKVLDMVKNYQKLQVS